MSTPVSGAVIWTTPVTISSLAPVTSTDLNNLNKDVAFLRARPYTLVWQTSAPTVSTLGNSTDLSSYPTNMKILFATSNGGSAGTSISTSSVGTITLSSDGKLLAPATLAGLYRFNCQMMSNPVNNSHTRVSAILFDSSGIQIGAIPGTWTSGDNAFNPLSTVSFVIPMNVAGSPFGNVRSVTFVGQYVSVAANIVTLDMNANGPASSPKQFNTMASAEYLGTSTGSY